MSLSKPVIAVASFAAAASPAAAFQSAGNVVHRPGLTGRETRSQTSASTDMVSSSVSIFSSGLAVSGVATLAAAAVMASSTRHVPKPNAKTAMAFFGGAPGAAPSFDPSKELGVQEPLGFWDPAGFMKEGDEALFRRYRQTEIKHGRVAMLATMGYITPEITGKLPGYLSPSTGLKYEDIPNGLGAISKVPALGWAQMIAYAAFCELFQDQSPGTPGAKGDLGFKVLTSSDPVELEKKLSAEIANGRLAMMAIIGMFFQDGLTGSAWGDWANYTASPLRAFGATNAGNKKAKTAMAFFGGAPGAAPSFDPSKELGVQEPLGFWDPAGFMKEGDEALFRRYRQTEIKHGRVAMLATMGYITPEITGKLPGYLSPSTGLKYEDIPNGLGAISKVPALGWAQMIAYAAFCELSQDQSPGTPGAKGDLGFKVLTSSDPVELEKKLSAEIANGRLAMMAIIGMFFQDGLTGSAWGDWANYTASPLRAFGASNAESKKAKTAMAFFGGAPGAAPSFDPSKELGVQEPLGFWDPAGFMKEGDEALFRRYRQTEIKHGRVAMLATMGYITPEITGKLPGYLSPSTGLKYEDIPNGLGAISKVPALGWAQMIAYAAFCELSQDQSPGTPGAKGDLGFKVLTSSDPVELEKKLSAEIANGRLAMMAIIGMFFQDGLTGSAWGDWANYTASPLRAFGATNAGNKKAKTAMAFFGGAPGAAPSFDPSKELGVQEPLGFWDPAGFMKEGDEALFRRYRQTEIKHGRVAMLATMGYITPEITGKLPGYLSPSTGLKYEDIPNGLGAISKVPALGWAQMIAYAAFCELSQDQSPGTPGAKGDLGFKVLTSSDPVELEKKLSAEIANGRLAMMAIIGMFFQDGLTGSAWGDWANYTASPLRAEPVTAAAGAAAAAKAVAGAAGAKAAAAGAAGAKAAAGTAGAKAAAGTAAVKGSGAVGAGAGTGKSIQKEGEVKGAPNFDPSKQLGAMAPLGFWDPAGFVKVGDEAGFRNLRAAEIKHGRVAMMAAVGAVVQHYVQFPGFESVPKGLSAVTTAPGTYGVAVLFIVAGLLELGAWTESPDKEPGNFGDPVGLDQYTEEMRLRELNNGRFAMFAAIGIIAAELYTGLDAVEQLSV